MNILINRRKSKFFKYIALKMLKYNNETIKSNLNDI